VTGAACVIGLGSMGYGAAVSLLRAGIDVRGVDIRAEARERFQRAGGSAGASPAEGATGAGIIFTFVVNAEQTDEVLFGPAGAAATLSPGSVVAACATVAPAYAEELGRRLAAMGLLMLDAPVSGGAARAAKGDVTVMASGAPQAFAKAEPFLRAVAGRVYTLGDAPGIGSRVKMINQLLAGVHIAAAAEAMALGIGTGADPRQLYEVIVNSAGSSWMFQDRVPHVLAGDYTPRSAVNIFVKDLGIVVEAGRAAGLPLPMAEAAYRLFTTARDQGLGGEDDAAVIKVYAANGRVALPSPDKPAG
jgi:L-threonate 2-dehydrogenase